MWLSHTISFNTLLATSLSFIPWVRSLQTVNIVGGMTKFSNFTPSRWPSISVENTLEHEYNFQGQIEKADSHEMLQIVCSCAERGSN